MTDLSRRLFLARGMASAALPMVGLDDLGRIIAAVDDTRRYMDATVVHLLRRQLAAYAASDGARGPRQTLPPVLGVLAAVEHTARDARPTIRRELLSVGVEAAEFAGWLYRDIAVPELANYWRDRAIEWAQVTGDTTAQGYVLLKKSQAAWDQRDAVQMLTLAQAAREGPWRLPDKMRAEAAQQEARGHAMLSGDIGSIEANLNDAAELFPESHDGHRGTRRLGVHYTAPLLAIQTAICYCEAGRAADAVDIYQQHLTKDAFSRRDFGYFRSLMAHALLAAGAHDGAAAAGREALAVATATDSVRTIQELCRIARDLAPWASRPSVRQFRDQLATSLTTGR